MRFVDFRLPEMSGTTCSASCQLNRNIPKCVTVEGVCVRNMALSGYDCDFGNCVTLTSLSL
jgi:hypothetical protein